MAGYRKSAHPTRSDCALQPIPRPGRRNASLASARGTANGRASLHGDLEQIGSDMRLENLYLAICKLNGTEPEVLIAAQPARLV
jgi:hypothetical protein